MFYDVRFDAIAPKSADSTEQEEVIRLIINVEAQTKFKPGYPLTKRAIYYCSRMISAQHGPIFKKSEYGKIRKVYSIWICTQPSDGFENTLTRYSIKPEQLIGEAQEETENYDLMSVVMICLGKPGTENHRGILKFMEVLLSSTRSGSEKKKILEEEFGVAMSEELEREVLEVCNLSQGVRAEGREEGRQEGRIEGIGIGEIRMLVQLVREGDLPLERAAAKAKMTVEQFKETMLEILHERERKALIIFSALERQEEKLSAEKAELVKLRVALYEQYADGNMSKEEFIRQRDAYRVQEDERMEQIQRLRTEKDQIFQPVKKDTDNLQAMMNTVGEAGDVMHLSQNVVEAFIDRIEVFNDERVKIHFTFEDVLADHAE